MWWLKKSWHELILLLLLTGGMIVVFTAAACSKDSTGPVIAAENSAAESTMPFPAAGEAADWTPAGNAKNFSGEQLFDHIDGGADIYFEYGFDRLLVRELTAGEKKVSLEIYRMTDSAAAFGIFSYNRHPSLPSAGLGTDSVIHPNGLFFWQDRYYVDIRQLGSTPIPPEETLALARAVSVKIASTATRPEIMDSLPQENRVPGSEVFARGRLAINNQVYVADEDLFGLKKGEAAAIARYRLGQPEFSVIIARYASADACQDGFTRFRNHFIGGGGGQTDSFTVSPMPGKHDAIGKIGEKLVVVANADSGENAWAMLKTISESDK
jgi:hypothetical protein